MRLWSIQPEEVAAAIARGDTYTCDPELSPHVGDKDYREMFVGAYQWISGRLAKVTPRPEGVVYPAWAWHTWDGHRSAPDLSHEMFEGEREGHVILELEVPDAEVLLTDYIMYIFVLNRQAAFLDEEYEEWEARGEDDDYFDIRFFMGERCRYFLEDSWNKHVVVKNVEPINSDTIQACFWQIKPEYVVRTRRAACAEAARRVRQGRCLRIRGAGGTV